MRDITRQTTGVLVVHVITAKATGVSNGLEAHQYFLVNIVAK